MLRNEENPMFLASCMRLEAHFLLQMRARVCARLVSLVVPGSHNAVCLMIAEKQLFVASSLRLEAHFLLQVRARCLCPRLVATALCASCLLLDCYYCLWHPLCDLKVRSSAAARRCMCPRLVATALCASRLLLMIIATTVCGIGDSKLTFLL